MTTESNVERVVSLYLRKSTKDKRQKWSHDRQRTDCEAFCKANGFKIDRVFVESDSGLNDYRPVLKDAIDYIESNGQALVVSHVSRLGRKLSTVARYFENESLTIFVASLGIGSSFMELMVHAMFAAQESRAMGERLKATFAQMKLDNPNLKLGSKNPTVTSLPSAWKANKRKGDETALRYGKTVAAFYESGLSWRGVARQLNILNLRMPSGKRGQWKGHLAKRIYDRFKQIDKE